MFQSIVAAPLAVLDILARVGDSADGAIDLGLTLGNGDDSTANGSGSSGPLEPLHLALIGGIGLLVLIALIIMFRSYWAYRKARKTRAQQVRQAAIQAAKENENFAPDTVIREATALWKSTQHAWHRRDRKQLAELASPELLADWLRKLDDFERRGWHNVTEPVGKPKIEYLGLVNREGDDDDRVVVRITAYIEDYVVNRFGLIVSDRDQQDIIPIKMSLIADNISSKNTTRSDDTTVRVTEWWTLKPCNGQWQVITIEQDDEGRHHLNGDILPTPTTT